MPLTPLYKRSPRSSSLAGDSGQRTHSSHAFALFVSAGLRLVYIKVKPLYYRTQTSVNYTGLFPRALALHSSDSYCTIGGRRGAGVSCCHCNRASRHFVLRVKITTAPLVICTTPKRVMEVYAHDSPWLMDASTVP